MQGRSPATLPLWSDANGYHRNFSRVTLEIPNYDYRLRFDARENNDPEALAGAEAGIRIEVMNWKLVPRTQSPVEMSRASIAGGGVISGSLPMN